MAHGDRKNVGGPAKALGAYLPRVARAAFETHGFPSAALLTDWPAIAGAEMATFTAPERLVWPRRTGAIEGDLSPDRPRPGRSRAGATLVLRVEGPRAIEVQLSANQILDRINACFGYRAVTDLRIVQGPVARRPEPRATPEPQQPPPESPELERIADGELRAALARLAVRIGRE